MENHLKRSRSDAEKNGFQNGTHESTTDTDDTNYPKLSNILVFYVNGVEVRETAVEPEWTLLYYLRNKLGLCGTKLGCAEGGCGACTVMISKFNRQTEKPIHYAANACLTPVCAVHGMSVTTVEGIGSTKTRLHPVQERIAKAHGSQCGFCTPGIVMSMYALLRSMPKPQITDLEIAFQGNLCRCTGYRAIIEGYKTFTEEWEKVQRLPQQNGHVKGTVCAMGENCCKRVFTSEPNELFDPKAFRPYDPTQEPIFPPKLQISAKYDEEYLILKGRNITWYRPLDLKEILSLKKTYPNAKIIVGNTEVGVEMKFRNILYPVLIQPTKVKEMCEITESKEYLQVGASVTLVEMEEKLREQIKIKPECKTRIFAGIVEMLHWFAGKQIRNVAAVGGNIMTGSPISDLNPVFMAAGIKLNLCSLNNGFRSVTMDHTFFTGYRRNIVTPDELLVSISIPFSLENQFFVAYKQAKRRDDDIAIVNMALNVILESDVSVKKLNVAFGGLAPTTVLATKTSEKLVGKKWNFQNLEMIYDSLNEEFPLAGNAPGGMILYRRSLTLSLFFKGFISVVKSISNNSMFERNPHLQIPKEWDSIPEGFHYKMPCSSQYYQVAPEDQRPTDLIGRPVVHVSAMKQATGEAIYCDDVPKVSGELYAGFVISTQAHANILKVDPTKALEMEGVIAFFDAKDAPNNKTGPIFHDEEVFYSTKVTSQGQVIGIVVAVDQLIAQRAAKNVKVDYEILTPIVSIEDAILKKSYFAGFPISITSGDADKGLAESDYILTGEARMGGQEHFYLETNACVAIPREEDEIELICSTQHPAEIQKVVAELMHLTMNKVVIRAKRLGGGFGGKESRAAVVALPVSLAAHKLRKPVRCMLDRDEDMMMSGTRHPFLHKYKVGFNKDGKIQALEIVIYANAGYSMDLSRGVIERAMFHCENAYHIPNTKIIGYVCKTNLPTNTAFRGFGGPQGMFAAENFIREIADFLHRDPVEIAGINLYREGDVTPYKQVLTYCTMERCWQQCLEKSNFHKRLADIRRYNKEHRFKKRGISILPTKFGIAFTVLFLNQGGSLVHIYQDGSVMIAHGGVEMGQGLHTKMIQVASRTLKVDPSRIHIPDTATDKVPNSSPTAASASSDLYGMAVLKACTEIMNRIQPIIDKRPEATWEEWIREAYLERISLSSTGFYKTPDIGYCFDTNSGVAFDYFTYGVACSEVEIDCLTGDHQLLRTDIVMDLGESLNPAIDIGQVEGGFVQGYGLYTMEELMYSPTGTLLSRGPGAYKIPGFADIPQEFNVSLLKGAPNPRAVYSSKAVGEPPLFLACSAFFAIKEAIRAAREDMNIKGPFNLESPATSARIRMACVDELTLKVGEGDGKPAWNLVP